MRLAVELHGTVVGTLADNGRAFDFSVAEAGVERFGTNSTVLSIAIPLTPTQRRDHASRRQNWFNELLPEGDQYAHMVAQGGIRRGDTLGFLARYGRDVAGALQIWDMDDPTEPRPPGTRPLSEPEIRALLQDPIASPLGNDPLTGKSSLGGVQPKIVLIRSEHGWAQALGGAPTTHILKPRIGDDTTIFDEEYGSRIARRIGLTDFGSTLQEFDGLPALVIERYDRHPNGERIHQEDFSQALGAERNEKYQELGGVVSLQRVADALKRHAPESALHRLARMVIVTVAIGNLDMHTKNISLLHPPDGEIQLAPSYDLVPQAHQPNDGRLALAVNGVYRHADVSRDDLVAELSGWGLRRASAAIDECLEQLAFAIDHESPHGSAFPRLQEQLSAFVENLRSGRPAGRLQA